MSEPRVSTKMDPRRVGGVEIPSPTSAPRGRIDKQDPYTSWFVELELSSPKTFPLRTQTLDTLNQLSFNLDQFDNHTSL
jgi:hypothetical protein